MNGRVTAAEAAAIVAAIERFHVDAAAAIGEQQTGRVGPWQRAALIEGVGKRVTIEDREGEGGARWLS